jgi:hypothetical protein
MKKKTKTKWEPSIEKNWNDERAKRRNETYNSQKTRKDVKIMDNLITFLFTKHFQHHPK